MSHDFAKKKDPQKKRSKTQKSSKAKKGQSTGTGTGPASSSSWLWFATGFVFGVFVCALAYLSGVTPEPQSLEKPAIFSSDTEDKAKSPKPRFDFYTLLPEQKIELPDVEPLEAQKQATPISHYLLQAGSFRRLEDADRRRAELILIGLDATISDTSGTTGRWYRVQVGPFETRSKLAKARGALAERGIDTLLLKRDK